MEKQSNDSDDQMLIPKRVQHVIAMINLCFFLSQYTILGIIHFFLTPLVGRVWIMGLGIDNVNMHRKLMHVTILRQNETSMSS